jgi:membrane protein required for colicin V production
MANLSWIDFLIFGIFFLSLITGFTRGFFKEIVSLLVLIVAMIVTIRFTQPISSYLSGSQGTHDVISSVSMFTTYDPTSHISSANMVITMLLLFVGTYCTGEAVNYFAPINISRYGITSLFSRILGGGMGLIRGYVFSLFFILIVGMTPAAQLDAWTHSYFIPQLSPDVAKLSSMINAGG